MIRNILIVILVIGLAGTAYWAYEEHQEKNAILIHAENNYQRSFNDLAYRMDVLNEKIGSTLAMNSRQSLSPALAEVWRMTSDAHGSVGQLPLTLMPFNKTEEFLTNIGDFAYKTSIRDLDKSPLTDEEYKTLQKLYERSNDIQTELRKVQNQIMTNDLKWMDVEKALADTSGDSQKDNQVIDGLKTVEKNVTTYGQRKEFGPSFVTAQQKNKNYENLQGKEITRKEAIDKAKNYARINKAVNVKVTENEKGSKYGFYHVSMKDQSTGEFIGVDITKKGGLPIYLMNDRKVSEPTKSLNDGYLNAQKYLKTIDFNDLELSESTQYRNVGVYTFVSIKDGIRIYPESIKVKVALDNGEIIGLVAGEYLRSHIDRKLEKPAVSEAKARETISSKVEIMDHNMALITNDLYEDVLCHEFLGTIGNDTYRIFINAKDGHEEKVEKMHDASREYEQVL